MAKANKKVTLEKLAEMIAGGFAEMTVVMARKDDMNKRFNSVDKEMKGIKEDILDLQLRLARVEGALNEHGDILSRHSEELNWLHRKIDEMTNPQSSKRITTHRQFIELERRVSALEKKTIR